MGLAASAYFLQALRSAFKHPPPSDHKFIGLRLACCRKIKGPWLPLVIHVRKESWKAQGTDFSKFHPHEERLARRIYIHQARPVLRLNRKGSHQTFSCFVAWDLTNTLRAFQADSFGESLPIAAGRYPCSILPLADLGVGIRHSS